MTVLLKKDGKGGQFDLGDTDYVLSFQVGDAIVADGSTFTHGNRKFWGKQEDRIIILFIVHHTICSVNGV